jgi:hypothetical protein
MGIYQRNIENYTQTPVVENKMLDNSCVNCHSFRLQNPSDMVFHTRGKFPGTYLIAGDIVEKMNTKTGQTISALVYPSWHPSGRYITFSVNATRQIFHAARTKRVEVYDEASDVVVYDIAKHEIITAPSLFSKTSFESFPSFSPDGKTLYFCTSDSCKMPEEFEQVKYSLCSIAFDPEKGQFGDKVDTLYNVRKEGKSISFPRVSPDGNYLLYAQGDYGGFLIWHKEADLYMMNLSDGRHYPLSAANSEDADSYHSWSSNSRWIVFSSRRIDGLYTRLFITYVDESGIARKAFLLPQKDVGFYHGFMKSYNVPEFVKDKVNVSGYSVGKKAKNDKGVDVTFRF